MSRSRRTRVVLVHLDGSCALDDARDTGAPAASGPDALLPLDDSRRAAATAWMTGGDGFAQLALQKILDGRRQAVRVTLLRVTEEGEGGDAGGRQEVLQLPEDHARPVDVP